MIALYELTTPHWKVAAYEVVRIRQRGTHTAFGKTYEPAEYLPSTEQWGRFGWSYPMLEDARAKFRAISLKTLVSLNTEIAP
jgi:hypothetical protein